MNRWLQNGGKKKTWSPRSDDKSGQRGVSEAESIPRLQAEERALLSALAEFDHEARRVRDRLERHGGRAFVLEARLSQLEQNMATTKRDLERVRTKLQSLRSANE